MRPLVPKNINNENSKKTHTLHHILQKIPDGLKVKHLKIKRNTFPHKWIEQHKGKSLFDYSWNRNLKKDEKTHYSVLPLMEWIPIKLRFKNSEEWRKCFHTNTEVRSAVLSRSFRAVVKHKSSITKKCKWLKEFIQEETWF